MRLSRTLTALTITAVCTFTALAQQPADPPAAQPAGEQPAAQPAAQAGGQTAAAPAKQVKDRGEFDLYTAATTEQNPQKRLEVLNTWTQKYPDSDFKKERLLFFLTTYQGLNQPAKMIETANQILALDPKDFTSMYWLAILSIPPAGADTSATGIDRAERSATGMMENLDATFVADKKPQGTSDAVWTKTKTDSEAIAHKALGWAAMMKKDNDKAEGELTKALTLNPADGYSSYWLGQIIYGSHKPERLATGLFHFARADVYDGPGALPADGRKQVDVYLTKAYTGYHGDTKGLDELKALAKANVLPPADFKLKSIKDITKEQAEAEQKEIKDNPELAIWKSIKAELTSKGDEYFNGSVKGKALPKLRGTVVSQTPALRPKEIVLALSDSTTPEVTLKLTEGTMPGKAEAGRVVTFENAVGTAFTANPFMLTFELERKDIGGWPAGAAPATHHTGPAKRTVPKKK